MGVEIRRIGKVGILDASGSLKPGTDESEWTGSLTELLDDGTRKIILNLTNLDFMDSISLGETARCAARTRAAKGELKIVVKLGGKPEKVLRIASLDQVFEIFHDEAEAISSFIK